MKSNEKRNLNVARNPEIAFYIIYFAYGSNLDVRQMEDRCPGAVLLGKATLQDHELAFDTAGYLSVEEREGSHVQGALWTLSRANVASLDHYEGVASGCYSKRTMTVEREGDVVPESIDALVYVSNRTPLRKHTERFDYLDRVFDAGHVMQLDDATLAQMFDMRADSLARLRAQEESVARGAAKIALPIAREYADFVCQNGHQIADCTCGLGPGYYAYRFPCGLQQHERVLRSKRYQVMDAQEASFCGSHRIFLSIKTPGSFGYKIDVPEGFRALRGSDPVLQANLSYTLTLEEFERERKALLRSLYDWCCALPEFDVKNFYNADWEATNRGESFDYETRHDYSDVPYFAFGFDISPARMAEKLEAGHHVYSNKAKLYGYKLVCDAKGRPTIMQKEGAFVEGVLWHGLTMTEVQALDRANGVQHGTYTKIDVAVRIEGTTAMGDPTVREEEAFAYISQRVPLSAKTSDVEAFGALRDEAIALGMERATVARIDAILRASGCPCAQPEAPAAEIAVLGISELTPEQAMKCLLFVCPKCFKPLGECECGNRLDHLVAIDHELQPHVRMLNEKGYETQDCCAGHANGGGHGYLSFRRSFRELDEICGGQQPGESIAESARRIADTRHAELSLPGIPESYDVYLDMRDTVIRFEPCRGVAREQFVADKPAVLDALLKWCESLPQCEKPAR